jgi:hypothetical protein
MASEPLGHATPLGDGKTDHFGDHEHLQPMGKNEALIPPLGWEDAMAAAGHAERSPPQLGNASILGEQTGDAVAAAGHAELSPPHLGNASILGEQMHLLRKHNKQVRVAKQRRQLCKPAWWTTHKGKFVLPDALCPPGVHRNHMCPSGLALHHPAASKLLQYATGGCPTRTGNPWTQAEMQAAIDRGLHASSLIPEAAHQLDLEVEEKVKNGQARLVRWKDICHRPPTNLKISPVAMVPHKSRPFRAILDLSFSLRLSPTKVVPSVNSMTEKKPLKDWFCSWGIHWDASFIHLLRPTTTQTSSWQNGISKMGFGDWIVKTVRNGTLRTYSRQRMVPVILF